MKKGMSAIILVLAILLLVGGIAYYLYESGLLKINGEQIIFESNDMFFVTESGDKYGISKSDGSQVLECRFTKILRNGNSVYLFDGTESYVFFLDNNKSISLGGKESDVNLVYSQDYTSPLPYFILTYGEANSSVYRIYTDQGVRYNNRDFTSYEEAVSFLDAKSTFKPIQPPKTISDKYNVKSTLSYPTAQNRSQYIVSSKEKNSSLLGIVDETGRIVLDIACTNIYEISGRTKGTVVTRNEKTYLFLTDEKLLEVDSGFEFVTGNNVIYQKKGDTVNKVYNTKGEVVIDGIYSYSNDFYSFLSKDGSTYIMLNTNDKYELYNINNNQKYQKEYTNLSTDYLKKYYADSNKIWETGFIYVSEGIPYCVDFATMKESRMNVVININAPLDLGYKYEIGRR